METATKPEQVSSMMEKPTYNPETKELTIKFKKGGTYIYPNFDPNDADAFIRSESWGKAYHAHKSLFTNGVRQPE